MYFYYTFPISICTFFSIDNFVYYSLFRLRMSLLKYNWRDIFETSANKMLRATETSAKTTGTDVESEESERKKMSNKAYTWDSDVH